MDRSGYSLRSENRLLMEHRANHIIYVFNDRIHIAKNRRSGPLGDISLEQFIDCSLEIIAEHAHHGVATVFQEGLKIEMKEALIHVLEKNLLKVVKK